MNEKIDTNQVSNRVRAQRLAGQIRRDRLARVRERETRIERAVVDVLAAKLAITEAEHIIADGVSELKSLGETRESIGELCEMAPAEVRAALASGGKPGSAKEASKGGASISRTHRRDGMR